MSSHTSLIHRARQARVAAADMPSPCISVCTLSPSGGLCLGCFRTLDEIAAWSRMGVADKRAVWTQIEQRAGIEPEVSKP